MDSDQISANSQLLLQKGTAVQRQLETFTTMMNSRELSLIQGQLRFERIKNLFREYEDLCDELSISHPNSNESDYLTVISNQYYEIAEHLTSKQIEHDTSLNVTMGNSTMMEKRTLQRLPIPQLPVFSGDYNEWISFSNLFRGIIDNRDDIADIIKFQYLKTCLKGEAAQRITHLQASDDNYQVAWSILKGTYELKRVLRNKHIGAISNLKNPETATPDTLGYIVNTVRQNLTSLETLGSLPAHNYLIWHLERILPESVSEKWQDTLKPDDSPTVEQMFKFLEATISRMHTKFVPINNKNSNHKRFSTGFSNNSKAIKNFVGERVLVMNARGCSYCKVAHHFIYQCKDFDKLTVAKRWEFVKQQSLCKNCLYKHASACTSKSRCKHCGRFHHSKLHYDQNQFDKFKSNGRSAVGTNHLKPGDPSA